MSDDVSSPGEPASEAEEGETVFLGPSGAAVKGEPPLATQPAAGGADPMGSDELARGSVVDRFVILDVVGRGGMGVVYAAYDPDLDRKIALKLVRPNRPGAGEGQLLREAQAIARLSHPNVVAVYDVGTHRDQVFLAMELVEGRNLGPWLAQAPRSVREILDVFIAAGRGLAAAHAAGLVHRDFKPDNVLIGNDGRVRVADFGVARRFESAGEQPAEFRDLPEEARSARATRSTVAVGEATRFGMAVGTVPYMAPEQLRRGVADAKSDQFAFSIALFEALYGERPFAGQGALDLALAMESGELRTPNPPGRRIPPAFRAALGRGLAFDPAARFSSMDELLSTLAHDPEAARRRAWGIAAVLALLIVAGFGLRELALRRARVCAGGEEKVADLWNPQRKAAVAAAFRATGLPFAEGTWAGVERVLDRYAADWAGMHREACEATRVRGDQSEALLDRRMFCLDQRLRDAGALIDLLSHADGAVVEKSVAASIDLPALASCADLSAINARVPPPADPKVRAAARIVGQQVAAARASYAAGQYKAGVNPARRAADAAGKIAYPPLRAEALVVLGGLEERTEDFAAARETLHSAWWTAEAGADDEVKTRAATELMRLERLQSRFDVGSDWGRFAAATLDRLGSEPSLKAGYLLELGLLRSEEGKYNEALVPLREAVALRRKAAERAELVGPLGSLGMVLHRKGEYEPARKAYEEALALGRRELGAEHPEVASMLQRVGNLLFDQGRYEESATYSRQALAIREKVLGKDHYQVGASLTSLGNALSELGRQAEALACYERGLALQSRAFGEGSPGVAVTLNNMANVYLKQRRFDLAEQQFRRVYEIRSKALGPEHPATALALHNIGVTLDQSGQPGEALPFFEKSLSISEHALGPDHPTIVETLLAIADAETHDGHPERALPRLERALKAVEKGDMDADLGGRTRFALASVLGKARRDSARAKALAERAMADFASLGKDGEELRKEVEVWLAGRVKG
ncbi:MAG: serine/threonine-protein kinase [Acidobacteriota bacterium]